jgi:hypothetical protein
MAKSSPLLTDSQRDLLAIALGSGEVTRFITSSQRQAIRKICNAMRDPENRPEHILVAFKASLSEAANKAKIPLGTERNALTARLVSVFIEEFYRADATGRTNVEDDFRGKTAKPSTPAKTPDLHDAQL